MAIREEAPPLHSLDDEWSLNSDQMVFMLQYHNAILAAYDAEDDAFFVELTHTAEYGALFGKMSWDEAFDRYECMLDGSA